jgi:hypothetical protein
MTTVACTKHERECLVREEDHAVRKSATGTTDNQYPDFSPPLSMLEFRFVKLGFFGPYLGDLSLGVNYVTVQAGFPSMNSHDEMMWV